MAMANDKAVAYEEILERVARWAEAREDIRAVAIVGSRARAEMPADEWADLDVVLFTTDPASLVEDAAWVGNFGEVWLTFAETNEAGMPERRVLYEGMLDVDFVLVPIGAMAQLLDAGVAAAAVGRGSRVVSDKDGLVSSFSISPGAASAWVPPGERAFLGVVNDFWYHAVWTAKHLRRGELWWGKSGCDGRMKQEGLLPMLEWHARATRGADCDTWMRGRFLEKWADPRAVAALGEAFARYDRGDVARALVATMSLFAWLAREAAARLGYPYPAAAEERVTTWVKGCLEEGQLLNRVPD